jgi:hypothetical protein
MLWLPCGSSSGFQLRNDSALNGLNAGPCKTFTSESKRDAWRFGITIILGMESWRLSSTNNDAAGGVRFQSEGQADLSSLAG